MDGEMRIDEETGVCNARNRLDDVLQNLIDQADIRSESEDEKDAYLSDVDVGDNSIASSPKKLASLKSRKRKRKDESPQKDSLSTNHAYVMKMFDRSVDLAQFDARTPLYPICRAWINNNPQKQTDALTDASKSPPPAPTDLNDEELDDDKVLKNIHHLPKAHPQPIVDGVPKDLRIPVPLPPQKDDTSLDTYLHDETAAPQRDAMLLNHMNRWKEVKSRWKAAGHANEARFAKSGFILKALFEQ